MKGYKAPFPLLKEDLSLGDPLECQWRIEGKTVETWLCCLREKETLRRVRAVIRSLREQGYRVTSIDREGCWAVLHCDLIETDTITENS